MESDADGCEFDADEIVGRVLVVAGGYCSEVLDLVEEAFDEVAVAVQERAEGGDILAVRHRPDVGPCPLLGQTVSAFVAVVSPVAEQGLPRTEHAEHIVRGAAVMGLPLGQLESDGAALGIHQGMNLGGQAAARPSRASG